MRGGGEIEHQAHKMDAREQGIRGLDAVRIDADASGPATVTMSSDSAPCQSERLGEPPQLLSAGSAAARSPSVSSYSKVLPLMGSASTPSDGMSPRQYCQPASGFLQFRRNTTLWMPTVKHSVAPFKSSAVHRIAKVGSMSNIAVESPIVVTGAAATEQRMAPPPNQGLS